MNTLRCPQRCPLPLWARRMTRCGRADLASGKDTKSHGKSPFSMGKSTISMAIFNSKLLNYQRVSIQSLWVDCSNLAMTSKRWSVRETTPRWGSGLWAVGRDLWVTIKFLSWIETILYIILYIYIIIWARLCKSSPSATYKFSSRFVPHVSRIWRYPTGEIGKAMENWEAAGKGYGGSHGNPIFIVYLGRRHIINIVHSVKCIIIYTSASMYTYCGENSAGWVAIGTYRVGGCQILHQLIGGKHPWGVQSSKVQDFATIHSIINIQSLWYLVIQ